MIRQVFDRALRECGAMLLRLSESARAEGEWQGAQFKARADAMAHELLVNEFHKLGLPIVSEEDTTANRGTFEEYLIIDPIDGTASFAHGFPGWVVQVALMQWEQPVESAVFAPATNEFFHATKGAGAYKNDKRLLVNSKDDKIETIVDNYPEPTGVTLSIKNALGIRKYLESGSIGLKICRVADGSADLFYKAMEPRDWDLAAPQLILQESGGTLCDALGKPIEYGLQHRRHSGLIAARTLVQAQCVAHWHSQAT